MQEAESLADHSVAVGPVNLCDAETSGAVQAGDLGSGTHVKSARDLWPHSNVVFHDDPYTARIPAHGVMMLRVNPKRLIIAVGDMPIFAS